MVYSSRQPPGSLCWWRCTAHGTVREQKGRDKNRGVAYWTDGSESRILAAASRYLFSLDAKNGKPDTRFGNQGVVDLREGMAPHLEDPYVAARTPGIVFENLFIIGGVVDEVQGDRSRPHPGLRRENR